MIIVFLTLSRGNVIEAIIVFELLIIGSFIILKLTRSLAFPPTSFFRLRSKYLKRAIVALKLVISTSSDAAVTRGFPTRE